MKIKAISILICALLISTIGIASADWSPGDGHKMHFPQMPDPKGWDVDWGLVYLGDDWMCNQTSYVNDIHFWISWWNDINKTIPWIEVSIWSNNPEGPHGWSIPDELLWERKFQSEEFIVAGPWYGDQGWLEPPLLYYPNNHQEYFQINIVNITEPYLQIEGKVYWLVIDMPFEDLYVCGWKTTLDHFLDNAVFAFDFESDWFQIYDIDLAFVIDGEPPLPNLECEGDINWADAIPGETVTGYFKVGNFGETDSLLNWNVDSWPAWGGWSFEPSSGIELPAGNWINGTVTVEVPYEQYQNFSGNITIVNTDNLTDCCEINVYLETPRSRIPILPILSKVFSRIIQRFPILHWLLYQQLVN
jgi:hypothetical protein